MYSIETTNLYYYYTDKNEVVLKDINLKVPENSVYGFLGVNGSGKSTAMKLVLGLLKSKGGDIRLFGRLPEDHREAAMKNIGALIEAPAMYGHLSAKENLTILQTAYQCPSNRINEVLDTVGLLHTGRKKVSKFSLGMRQRLGIAQALLHSPKLLILDEPTNGLDVNGILEIRDLLKRLQSEGITVLISSHQLSEIEKVITHIGIISKGVLNFQGTMSELTEYAGKSINKEILLETDNMDKTCESLRNRNLPVSLRNGQIVINGIGRELVPEINRELVKEGISVYYIGQKQIDLETAFKQITHTN